VIIDGGGFTGAPPHVRAFCSLMSHPRFLRGIYPLFSFMYMRPRTDADRRARAGAIATTRRERSARVICGMWGSFSSPEHDLREQAGTITAPALVVWGRRDPVIPLSAARRIAAAISGSRLLVLPTGHVPYTTDPSAVAAELAAFAESLTPLSAASPS
jgi:pimeloyl-ACP methyl ester carboxylesterase